MCDLPTLIVLIAASALALARHRKSKQQRAAAIARGQAVKPGSNATAAEIEGFFAIPENCRRRHVRRIEDAIGPCSSCDEWGRGRWVYEWLRPGLRARVETNSGYICCVELLDPSDTSRVGTVIKTPYPREEFWDATAAEIEAFFAIPENCRGRHVDHIVAAIGPWSSYDDWDWGRLVYEWLRPGLRVRVETNSGYVRCVELLDPSDTSRVGTVIKALYQREELSDG